MSSTTAINLVKPRGFLHSSEPERRAMRRRQAEKMICIVFGTRPEAIKLAPVIQQLEAWGKPFRAVIVNTGQHRELLSPYVRLFGIPIHYDLQIMEPNQTLNAVCSRVLVSLDRIMAVENPDLVLFQGDTTTAMAAAMAAFHRRIPSGHVEAGLRSGNPESPYPEEMNRRLITQMATYHFAATPGNRNNLLREGIDSRKVFVTGNPVVDSLQKILKEREASSSLQELVRVTKGLKLLVLTTHRRESFGEMMAGNLKALREFADRHNDVALVFPVHPNPHVSTVASEILSSHPRIHLISPLGYDDFIHLLSHAWLIVSDSGGVQEEAPSLGKPLLILRENTERPEAVESGVARLVGGSSEHLALMLEEVYAGGTWTEDVKRVENPFGHGDSGFRIVQAIARALHVSTKKSPWKSEAAGLESGFPASEEEAREPAAALPA
jgi:UDP-N-acetylglucosamine 2-epimerase (non-hydrolysing)